MSEYQYYEFQAIDQPLTPTEMAELRALSSRAQITPTRFLNVYHWGDLKGDPVDWIKRYFDAFVYVANWGTHHFMVRLPRRFLDSRTVQPYAATGTVDVHARHAAVIVEFRSAAAERFTARLGPLRDRYARRPSRLGRLERAGLTV